MGGGKKWFKYLLCMKKVKGHPGRGTENLCSNPCTTIPPNITPLEDPWLPSSSSIAAVKKTGDMNPDDCRKHSNNFDDNPAEEEPEDEESLSLSDLPINDEENQQQQQSRKEPTIDPEEGFSFCSSWNDSVSKESEICIADEVFSHGRILPFESSRMNSRTTSRCFSMDRCSYSVGFTSRSSSINSHQSSSWGCGSSTATTNVGKNKPRSHQSTKPQIRSSNVKRGESCRSPNQKPTFWRFLRVGVAKMPEIAMQDLRFRIRSKASPENFGSSLETK